MTPDELAFLKSNLDEVVVIETAQGEHLLVQIIIVVDEGQTPDLFCIEVDQSSGSYVQRTNCTHSILLSDIVRVQPPPPLPLP